MDRLILPIKIHQFYGTFHVHFFYDVATVGINGMDADEQRVGNFAATEAPAEAF